MKIIITGANGFIGQKLITQLLTNSTNEIIALVRSNEHVVSRNRVKYIVGDLADIHDFESEFYGVDVVIHCAGRAHIMKDKAPDPLFEFRRVNRDFTISLATLAASNGVRRFIYLSSIKVLGEYTNYNSEFSHLSPPNPVGPYSISKLEAEVGLEKVSKETGLDTVIIRPPLVYGSSVGGNFEKLLKLVAMSIPLPFAAINNRRSMVSVENLVDFISLCVIHPRISNHTFLVSDGVDISTPNLISLIAETMGKKNKLFHFPQTLLKVGFFCLGKPGLYDRLCRSMVINIEHTRKYSGWSPPYDHRDSLKNCWKEIGKNEIEMDVK